MIGHLSPGLNGQQGHHWPFRPAPNGCRPPETSGHLTLLQHKSSVSGIYVNLQWQIQDFPQEGGMDSLGGHGPLTHAHFAKNVCKNERIGSHGGRAPGTPPRSANDL